MSEIKAQIKVVIVGPQNVGKSTLLEVLNGKSFHLISTEATIGLGIVSRTLETEHGKVKLICWDTPGQTKYRPIAKNALNGAMGIIWIYSQSIENSLEEVNAMIKSFLSEIEDEHFPMILVASKWDLLTEIKEQEQARALGQATAQKYHIDWHTASAKEPDTISIIFHKLVEKIFNIPRLVAKLEAIEKAQTQAVFITPNSPLRNQQYKKQFQRNTESRCICRIM